MKHVFKRTTLLGPIKEELHVASLAFSNAQDALDKAKARYEAIQQKYVLAKQGRKLQPK